MWIFSTLKLVKRTQSNLRSFYSTRSSHRLKTAGILGDEVNEISEEVKYFSKLYSYVLTTGGIGPTHDDVTFEAVAKAFDVPLIMDPHLTQICERFYKTTDKNHPGMKLAMIPQTAKLNFANNSNYPNISIENVYMFPGIPELFIKSFSGLSSKLFKSDGTTFYTKCIYVNLTEDKIAEELSLLVTQYPDVQFGSYPKLFHESYKVKITIESTNEKLVSEAYNKLIEKFPPESVVAVS